MVDGNRQKCLGADCNLKERDLTRMAGFVVAHNIVSVQFVIRFRSRAERHARLCWVPPKVRDVKIVIDGGCHRAVPP